MQSTMKGYDVRMAEQREHSIAINHRIDRMQELLPNAMVPDLRWIARNVSEVTYQRLLAALSAK